MTHDVIPTVDYQLAMLDARRLVEELHREAVWPLPRLVWRARALYRQCWLEERVRTRPARPQEETC